MSIKPFSLLVAGLPVFDHCCHQRDFIRFKVKRIVRRQDIAHAFYHIRHQVNPDQIIEAEYTGLWNAHRSSENSIGLCWRQAEFECRMQGALNRIYPDPVTQETGSIKASNHAFAQLPFAKCVQPVNNFRRGGVTPNQFQQTHESNRVEKMGNGEPFAKGFRHIPDQ